MEKEKWVNKVLMSADQLERVAPSETLWNKIESKIEGENAKIIPIKWLVGIAASFLVLVCMNLVAIKSNKTVEYSENELEVIETDFNSSNHLY